MRENAGVPGANNRRMSPACPDFRIGIERRLRCWRRKVDVTNALFMSKDFAQASRGLYLGLVIHLPILSSVIFHSLCFQVLN